MIGFWPANSTTFFYFAQVKLIADAEESEAIQARTAPLTSSPFQLRSKDLERALRGAGILQTEVMMKKDKVDGVKEQIKGMVNLGIGRITGNEERALKGEVEITNGSNKKDKADFEDNVEKDAVDPDNPSNV